MTSNSQAYSRRVAYRRRERLSRHPFVTRTFLHALSVLQTHGRISPRNKIRPRTNSHRQLAVNKHYNPRLVIKIVDAFNTIIWNCIFLQFHSPSPLHVEQTKIDTACKSARAIIPLEWESIFSLLLPSFFLVKRKKKKRTKREQRDKKRRKNKRNPQSRRRRRRRERRSSNLYPWSVNLAHTP